MYNDAQYVHEDTTQAGLGDTEFEVNLGYKSKNHFYPFSKNEKINHNKK